MSDFWGALQSAVRDEQTRLHTSRRCAGYRAVCSRCGATRQMATAELCAKCYRKARPRRRVTLDLTSDPELMAWLEREAKSRQCTPADLLKELCRGQKNTKKVTS